MNHPPNPDLGDSMQDNNPWKCFIPLQGVAVGFALGWVVHLLVAERSEAMDIASRFLMLVFGIFGWAASTVVTGRQLHCGGTKERDDRDKNRYVCLATVGVALLIISAAALVRGLLWVYYPVVLFLLSSLAGEIGWGNALRIFEISRKKKNGGRR
jgi:hypothetical protein